MITSSDSLGSFVDTGVATQPTVRASVEVEAHSSTEVDTGSKLTVAQIIASHVPHRGSTSPR